VIRRTRGAVSARDILRLKSRKIEKIAEGIEAVLPREPRECR
jgi:hypothetical protein